MKILFVTMPVNLQMTVDNISMRSTPCTAIYLLAAILKENNFPVDILDPYIFKMNSNIYGFEEYVTDRMKDVDVLCISSNTINWPLAAHLIETVKKSKSKNIKIILGGLHPTYFYRYILSKFDVDYIIVGEGEKNIVPLMRAIECNEDNINIEGVVTKENIGKTCGQKISENEYANLPLPMFEDMPNNVYLSMPLETSRGCKFKCKFCSIAYKNDWRGFPKNVVLERCDKSINKYKKLFLTNQIFVTDDCLTADMHRAISIVDGLFNIGPDRVFMFETRITDWFDKEREDAAILFSSKQTGRLGFGIECGYDEGLKKISKGLSIDNIDEILKFLDRKKMIEKAYFSFIIGFPWETMDECLKTIEFAAEIEKRYGTGIVNLNWLYLYPSFIWDHRKEYGIMLNEDIFDNVDYNSQRYFNETHPSISLDEKRFIDYTINEYESRGIYLRNI